MRTLGRLWATLLTCSKLWVTTQRLMMRGITVVWLFQERPRLGPHWLTREDRLLNSGKLLNYWFVLPLTAWTCWGACPMHG
jgi:hypothetical protein